MDQIVCPMMSGFFLSLHSNSPEPYSLIGIPKWFLYHLFNSGTFLPLKKIPLMPVTRFIVSTPVSTNDDVRIATSHTLNGVKDERLTST
jgi:hypothetical protein